MKKKDLKDLGVKANEELEKEASRKRLEIKKIKAEMVVGRHKNIRIAKNLRRDLSQILTILKGKAQKEKNENL